MDVSPARSVSIPTVRFVEEPETIPTVSEPSTTTNATSGTNWTWLWILLGILGAVVITGIILLALYAFPSDQSSSST